VSRSDSMEYAIRIFEKKPEALVEPPRLIVGTIHSVKGGEADDVWMFPDLSSAGMQEWLGNDEQRDSVIRQFYVGMTRARENLTICAPASRLAVTIH